MIRSCRIELEPDLDAALGGMFLVRCGTVVVEPEVGEPIELAGWAIEFHDEEGVDRRDPHWAELAGVVAERVGVRAEPEELAELAERLAAAATWSVPPVSLASIRFEAMLDGLGREVARLPGRRLLAHEVAGHVAWSIETEDAIAGDEPLALVADEQSARRLWSELAGILAARDTAIAAAELAARRSIEQLLAAAGSPPPRPDTLARLLAPAPTAPPTTQHPASSPH